MWISGICEKVKHPVEEARKGSGEPRLYETFEPLVNSFHQ